MLRDLIFMNELFNYLVKVADDLGGVEILKCNIQDRYNNGLAIRIEFDKYFYKINIYDTYVKIENTDTYKNKTINYNSFMDLMNILEKFRKSIDNFE